MTAVRSVRSTTERGAGTQVFVNDPVNPLAVSEDTYGYVSLAVDPVVGGRYPFRSDVAEFQLWCRRMEDAEFATVFARLQRTYGL
jgi:hypothetical protein